MTVLAITNGKLWSEICQKLLLHSPFLLSGIRFHCNTYTMYTVSNRPQEACWQHHCRPERLHRDIRSVSNNGNAAVNAHSYQDCFALLHEREKKRWATQHKTGHLNLTVLVTFITFSQENPVIWIRIHATLLCRPTESCFVCKWLLYLIHCHTIKNTSFLPKFCYREHTFTP